MYECGSKIEIKRECEKGIWGRTNHTDAGNEKKVIQQKFR